MDRKFEFSIDEYYHVYQRGVGKQKVFLNYHDRLRFLLLLYVANTKQTIHLSDYWYKDDLALDDVFNLARQETLIDIGAYCLMPNHFHLLIREKSDHGTSIFMQKMVTGYSMYFNKKYQHTGSVFERPFKAKHINDDDYLRYLFAYIHLNPIKINDPSGWGGKKITDPNEAKIFLDQYRFSSYRYYLGYHRPDDSILNRTVFPEYFEDRHDFDSFIKDWFSFDDEPIVKATP